MNLEGVGGEGESQKRTDNASCCCLKLDKALHVNLLEVGNALLSPLLLFTFVSGDDIVCPIPSSKNVPLQHPLCKIGVKYSQ